MALRFFADHCISNYVMQQLRQQGHEVLRLGDYLPTDSPDPVVIAKTQELDAILLSLNGDFSDIVNYPPAQYGGIIGLQIKNHPEITTQVVERLGEYLSVHDMAEHYRGKLFLVEAHRIRIRS